MADNYNIGETSQPILPYIINEANKDDVVNHFGNNSTYSDGESAQQALLKILQEQRAAYEENTTDNYLIKQEALKIFDNAITKLNSIDVDGLDGTNASKNSQYILSIATAFESEQSKTSDSKVMFDPREFEATIAPASNQSSRANAVLEGNQGHVGGLSSSTPPPRDPSVANGNKEAWLNTSNAALNEGRELINEIYSAPLPELTPSGLPQKLLDKIAAEKELIGNCSPQDIERDDFGRIIPSSVPHDCSGSEKGSEGRGQ